MYNVQCNIDRIHVHAMCPVTFPRSGWSGGGRCVNDTIHKYLSLLLLGCQKGVQLVEVHVRGDEAVEDAREPLQKRSIL